jgi:hypothetical protein
MTRLPAVTARELVAVAEKLGFVLDRQKGSHAVFIRIMRSNSRDRSGWMWPDCGGAEELPIHAQGRIFLVGSSPP